MDLFFFFVFGFIAVACAVNVILQKHPISSALSLIGVLGSIAVLYLQLGAVCIATAQVIVYAGAIMVLFVFVIMLLNAGAEQRAGRSLTAQTLGLPLLLALLGAIAFFVQKGFADAGVVKFNDFQDGTAEKIGYSLFTDYLLPFEVTSLLILVAIVGAVVLARKELE